MWFSSDDRRKRRRKAKSRSGSHSFLRVNISAKDKRSFRIRALKLFVALATLAAAALLIKLAVDWTGLFLFRENDLFRMQPLDVRCHGEVISPETVKEFLRIDPYSNLFDTDIGDIRNRLLSSHSCLKSVDVSRRLDGRLVIEIWEREPLARLFASRAWMYIDDEGRVLGPVTNKTELPIISARTPPGMMPGDYLVDSPLMDAIELLNACATTQVGEVVRVEKIDVLRERALRLHLKNGTVAKFAWTGMGERTSGSSANLESKLLRLAENIIEADRRGERILEIDMTVEKSFPARLAR